MDEDGNRICGKTQVLEHVHASDCFQPVAPAETDAFTEGEQARIDELIAAIDGLPTQEEIEAALNAYEEAGDEDGYEAYFEELYHGVMPIYVNYQALAPEQQELVTNREKLLELEWLWSAMPMAVTNTVEVTAVNSFSWGGYGGALIVHGDNGLAVRDSGMGDTDFLYWYAVRVEYENNRFVVKQVETNNGSSKRDVWASGTGFILLFHTGTLGTEVNVSVGDTVTVSGDFWKTKHDYNGTVYGTVTFNAAAAQKNAKDNTNQLHIVPAASTRDFIELNLYDYGSGSAGRNINDKFNTAKNAHVR